MFIGVYLCLSGMTWILGLFLFLAARVRIGAYSALALAFAASGLVLFTLLSMWLGLVRFGIPYNLNIPDDYYLHGVFGIATLIVGLAGVLSPLYAAWYVKRKKGQTHAEL